MKQKYKFLFRAGEVFIMTILPVPIGGADKIARATAKRIGKETGSDSVFLIWYGPEDERIPEDIRGQIQRERAS